MVGRRAASLSSRYGDGVPSANPGQRPGGALVASERGPNLWLGRDVAVPGDATFGANVVVHAGTVLGAGVALGSGCVVGAGARIGDGAVVGDQAHVGAGAELGPRSVLGRGSGLGLAIARWISERHGGEISVSSRSGEGSIFTVELSLAAASQSMRGATD